MGINNVLTAKDLFYTGKSVIEANPSIAGLADMVNVFANAPFVFLPVLIGFSATKRFGGNPYLGAALAMLMVHPDVMNFYVFGKLDPATNQLLAPALDIVNQSGQAVDGLQRVTSLGYWDVFGFKIAKVGYQGTVLPILAAAWVLATIEKFLRRVTPSWLDNLTTPLVSLFVTGFVTFAWMGPVLREAGTLLGEGLQWLYTNGGFVGAGIFWSIICTNRYYWSSPKFRSYRNSITCSNRSYIYFPNSIYVKRSSRCSCSCSISIL